MRFRGNILRGHQLVLDDDVSGEMDSGQGMVQSCSGYFLVAATDAGKVRAGMTLTLLLDDGQSFTIMISRVQFGANSVVYFDSTAP